MKVSKIFGFVICGFLVLFMGYIALTKDGGYATSKEVEESLALNTPPPLNTETSAQTSSQIEVLDERDKQLLELQKSAGSDNSVQTSRPFASKCSACHGKNGEGRFAEDGKVMFPTIAGKDREFILSRLHDYKEDKVPNPLMKGLLINLSEDDMNALAVEVSEFGAINE